jgi:hypothetical protein
MIDYLQSVGDFGQHLDDSQVPEGFTHAVCLTAIEMCDQLTKNLSVDRRELPVEPSTT